AARCADIDGDRARWLSIGNVDGHSRSQRHTARDYRHAQYGGERCIADTRHERVPLEARFSYLTSIGGRFCLPRDDVSKEMGGGRQIDRRQDRLTAHLSRPGIAKKSQGEVAMQHYLGIVSIAVLALVASSVWAFAEMDEKGFVRIPPEKIDWKSPFGAGSTPFAFLYGDPAKPGIYVQRVKFPPNVFTRPHWHGRTVTS